MERWMLYPDGDSPYAVSDHGRVKRVGRARGGRATPHGMMTPTFHRGYPVLSLVLANGTRRQFRVHQLVTDAFLGPCPKGYEVNHKDCDRRNNHLDNLEYVTPAENMQHAIRNGRLLHRQAGGYYTSRKYSKLTPEQVREIRASSEGIHSIAPQYGVTPVTISHIRNRKTWKHLV